MECDEAEHLIELKNRQRHTSCRNRSLGKENKYNSKDS
jgi:hypothetical protein